ncbi:MAG: UDP-N-acetylglucosamine 2-epimerase (non-hydrolyzing), partial [Candidatus Thorarchaeota archaeon]
PEAVESGHAIVVGVDPRRFPTRIEQGMKDGLTGMSGHPYGSGNASKKTIDFLIRNLQ